MSRLVGMELRTVPRLKNGVPIVMASQNGVPTTQVHLDRGAATLKLERIRKVIGASAILNTPCGILNTPKIDRLFKLDGFVAVRATSLAQNLRLFHPW
jgi:hypothetical protein